MLQREVAAHGMMLKLRRPSAADGVDPLALIECLAELGTIAYLPSMERYASARRVS